MAEPSSTRRQIEQASRRARGAVSSRRSRRRPLASVLLVALGLFAPLPIALPALALVLLFFLWIAYLSWPVVSTSGKVLRGVMVGLVIAMAATRF